MIDDQAFPALMRPVGADDSPDRGLSVALEEASGWSCTGDRSFGRVQYLRPDADVDILTGGFFL